MKKTNYEQPEIVIHSISTMRCIASSLNSEFSHNDGNDLGEDSFN